MAHDVPLMTQQPGGSLLALLHLCDSLFPMGGFGYSDGLEAATSSGAVVSVADLDRWMDVCLDEVIGRVDGPALVGAWTACRARRWDTLALVDAEAIALKPSSAGRRSSRAMGLRLITTWHALRPSDGLERMIALAHGGAIAPALPTAFGAVAEASRIGRRVAVEAFAYTRLASTVSAAMRVMSLGQTDAHRLLARALDRVPTEVDGILGRDRLESCAPAKDVATMTQQYLHSRLFRS